MQKTIQYIVPAILAFVVGFLLWHIQKEKIVLDYEVTESASFPRDGGSAGQFFTIKIRNNGNKQVNDTKLSVKFSSGIIESAIFSESEMIKNVSESKDRLSCDIPLLNPAEFLKLTITTIGNPNTSPPQVIARAPGTTARPRTDDAIFSNISNVVSGALFAALVTIIFSLATTYKTTKLSESISHIENLGEVSQRIEKKEDDLFLKIKSQAEELKREQRRSYLEFEKEIEKRKNKQEQWELELKKESEKRKKEHEELMKRIQKQEAEESQGKPTREQLIFAIFNRSGLPHKFSILVENTGNISYWRAGLFLLHSFLTEKHQQENYINATTLLVSLEMAPTSKGFLLYLLGKMEQFRKNHEKAIEWLEKCQNETPLMYDFLMSQDPSYDLEIVQKHLLAIEANNKNV